MSSRMTVILPGQHLVMAHVLLCLSRVYSWRIHGGVAGRTDMCLCVRIGDDCREACVIDSLYNVALPVAALASGSHETVTM